MNSTQEPRNKLLINSMKLLTVIPDICLTGHVRSAILSKLDDRPVYLMKQSSSMPSKRYDAILETATKLFGAKGYQSVSISEIAATAGVSKGLIHYHFGNKEDLLLVLVSSGRSIIQENLNEISHSNDTARNKIRKAIKLYLDLSSARLAVAQMMLIAFIEVPHTQKIRRILLEAFEATKLEFRTLIDEGLARGEIKPMDGEVATRFAIGMALETIKAITLEGPVDTDEAAEQITDVLFDGIGS